MKKVDKFRASYFGEMSTAIWESDKFRAHAYKDGDSIRLDIERLDGSDGITWDELQSIKNDCGFADNDAIEFYPKAKNVINSGNWRHLYVFDKELPLIRRGVH